MTAANVFVYDVQIDGTNIAGMTLTGATITYGATSQGQPPAPTTANMELITVDAIDQLRYAYPGISWNGGIPSGFVQTYGDTYEGATSALHVGSPVTVGIATDTGFVQTYSDTYDVGFNSTRFTGIITALDYSPNLVGITAVDLAEALNRIELDPAAWPIENENARVSRILTATGVTGTITGNSTIPIRAGTNTKPRTAWKHLVDVALSCGSIVWVDREGHLNYRTADALLASSTTTAPPAATLKDPLKMSSELGDVVNVVTITYGADQTVTAQNSSSIATYGRREKKIDTELDDPVDAQLFADDYVALHGDPAWHMPNATLHLGFANSADQIADLLTVDLDDTLDLPQLLPASPVTSYSSRVLGYTETLDPYDWLITYVLDPYGWSNT